MELILWVWAASRQVGELFELDEWSYAEFRLYARDGWNQLDTATFLLIMSAAVVRITTCGLDFSGGGGTCAGRGTEWEEAHDGAKWEGDTVDYIARNVYAVGVLCIWLRLLQFIQYEQTVGVLLIVLGAMRTDVYNFLLIQAIITGGFSVCFVLLLPLSNDGPWYHLLGPNIFWGSSWGLMGQFETDEQLEREGGHDPTSTLVPVRYLVITP